MNTPKHIFQTWKSKTVEHPVLKKWQESWKTFNPEFEYTLWDDDDNRAFISTYFADFLPIYDSYDREIKRADVVRYFYLYKYGGIYADLDFECLKPFGPIIDDMNNNNIDIVVGTLGKMDNPKHDLHDIPNAIMISRPESDFWKLVIRVLTNIGSDSNNMPPELATGPCILKICIHYYTRVLDEDNIYALFTKNIFSGIDCNFSSNIIAVKPAIFYPINWGKNEDREIKKFDFPDSYAVTYWMHSW